MDEAFYPDRDILKNFTLQEWVACDIKLGDPYGSERGYGEGVNLGIIL